jgi:hypothetical protein
MALNEQESDAGAPVTLVPEDDEESEEMPLAVQATESVVELTHLAVMNVKGAFRRVRRTVAHPVSAAAFAAATVIGLSSAFGLAPMVVGVGAVYFASHAVRRKKGKA